MNERSARALRMAELEAENRELRFLIRELKEALADRESELREAHGRVDEAEREAEDRWMTGN